MTDYANAERLRKVYLSYDHSSKMVNICRAKRNWNGCDYADVYAGSGLECWKQGGEHNCIRCERVERSIHHENNCH